MTFLEVQIQYNSRKPSLIWPIRAGEGSILRVVANPLRMELEELEHHLGWCRASE